MSGLVVRELDGNAPCEDASPIPSRPFFNMTTWFAKRRAKYAVEYPIP